MVSTLNKAGQVRVCPAGELGGAVCCVRQRAGSSDDNKRVCERGSDTTNRTGCGGCLRARAVYVPWVAAGDDTAV